jgi:hypothetical protein
MIYICTTAINRPDLHTFVFEQNKNFFNSNLEFTWIINIDCVSNLESTYDETKENYIKCIENIEQQNKKVIILPQSEQPSFTRAVKKICEYCQKIMKSGDILFWFEDDWIIKNEKYNIEHFINNMNDDIAFHLYQKCKIENLYPILRGYNLAKLFFQLVEKIPFETKDPEVSIKGRYPRTQFDIYLIKEKMHDDICCDMMVDTLVYNMKRGSSINSILQKDFDNNNNNIKNENKRQKMYAYNFLIFDDVGREYMKNLNIVKNTKAKCDFYDKIKNIK